MLWDCQKLFHEASFVLGQAAHFGYTWARSEFPNLSFTGQCSSDLFQSTHNVIVKTEQAGESWQMKGANLVGKGLWRTTERECEGECESGTEPVLWQEAQGCLFPGCLQWARQP